jgi:hypothetical protein
MGDISSLSHIRLCMECGAGYCFAISNDDNSNSASSVDAVCKHSIINAEDFGQYLVKWDMKLTYH